MRSAFDTLDTFLVGGIDTFPHLFFAVGIHIHIRENSGLVGPQVVVGAEEMNGELPDVVPHSLNVFWDCFGVADLCWPPPSHRCEKETTHGRSVNMMSHS